MLLLKSFKILHIFILFSYGFRVVDAFQFTARLLSRFSTGSLVPYLEGYKYLTGYLRQCKSFAHLVHHGPTSPNEARLFYVEKNLRQKTKIFEQFYLKEKKPY